MQKAYRTYFPSLKKIISSIHVKFDDSINGYTGTLAKGEAEYESFLKPLTTDLVEDERPLYSDGQATSNPPASGHDRPQARAPHQATDDEISRAPHQATDDGPPPPIPVSNPVMRDAVGNIRRF